MVRPACEDASAPKRAHALHSSRNAVRLSCSGRLVRAGADHCARHRNHSRRITGRSPGQQGRSRRLVVDHPHSFGSGCRDLVFHAKAWRARLNRTRTDNHIESVRHPRAIPAHEGITSQVTPSVRAKGPVLTKEAGLFWCQSFTPSALRGGISFSRLCLLARSKPPDRWPDPWRTALQTRTPSFGPAWPRDLGAHKLRLDPRGLLQILGSYQPLRIVQRGSDVLLRRPVPADPSRHSDRMKAT